MFTEKKYLTFESELYSQAMHSDTSSGAKDVLQYRGEAIIL